MNTQDYPFLVPPGSYPPATVRWVYNSVTVPPGFAEWVVPYQPGTPLGVLVPVKWQLSDLFFRVENPASSGDTTLKLERYTGTGPFATSNYLNDTPVVISAGSNECSGRPFSQAVINNPIVLSGDKLQPVVSLGAGASVVIIVATFVQYPAV